MDPEDPMGEFLGGVLLGAAAGAAVALLTARAPGAEVRRRLRHWGSDMSARASGTSCPIAARFREILDEGRRVAAERSAELRAQLVESQRPAQSGSSMPDEIELT